MFQKIARLIVVSSLVLSPSMVLAASLQSQINALEARVAKNQSTLNGISARADNLQSKVDTLNAQISELQNKIDLTNLKIKQTNQQIEKTKAELEKQKQIMFENARALYEEGDASLIEVLASSDSFTDFVNRQEYLEQVKESVNHAAQEVSALKDKLEDKVHQLQDQILEAKNQQKLIDVKRDEQAKVLAQARAQESHYQHVVHSQRAQIANLVAQQQAMYARISGGNGPLVFRNKTSEFFCGGGYDATLCSADKDSLVDQWQLYNRECVSYAAWAMEARYGKNVRPFGGAGNADQWPSTTSSYATVNHSPAAGTVAIAPSSMIGGVGHAMVVESVLGGGWIHVSQYNFDVTGRYSEMDVKSDGLIFIHF